MKNVLFFILLLISFTSCISNNGIFTSKSEHQGELEYGNLMADVIVNIEGTITEVSKDGKSFQLNNEKWIITEKTTVMGITGPNALPKEEQYFEPTFRVGNSIAGFSETPEGEIIVAYAIYTNWNWDDPIKR